MGQVRLGRDIASVVVLKLIVLSALYLLFFSGDQRPVIDPRATARHLLSSEPVQ